MESIEYYDSEDEGSYGYSDDNDWSHGESERELYSHESSYGNQPWYDEDYSSSDYGEEPDDEELEPEPPDGDIISMGEQGEFDMAQILNNIQTQLQTLGERLARVEQPPPARRGPARGMEARGARHDEDPDMPGLDEEPPDRYTNKPQTETTCTKMNSRFYEDETDEEYEEDNLYNNPPRREDKHYPYEEVNSNDEYIYGSWREETDSEISFGDELERDEEESDLDGDFGVKEEIQAKQPAKVKEVQADPIQQTLAFELDEKLLLDPHGKAEQCKSSNFSKVIDIICYRCHKRGHYAATCPTKKMLISTSLEFKTDSLKENFQSDKMDFKSPNSSVMHLSLSKGIDVGTGKTKEQVVQEDYPPPVLFKPSSKKEERFLGNMLLKEEPPDAQLLTKIQGMLLNPPTLQNINLTSLCAGIQVLRSKLLEEGGYDEVIRPVAEPKLHQSVFDNRLESSQDISAFERVYQTNQKELSNKQTYSRNLTQQGSCSKLNQHHRSSDEGVIHFTNRVISYLPDLDIGVLIGDFRPNQEEISYEPTCYGICIHQRLLENWNHTKIGFGLKVIQFLNQWFLGLPYLESHEFGQDQTFSWRPGDLSNDLQASHKSLQCSSTQRIRRILLYLHLPYLDVFTHKVLKRQQLFPYQSCCVLGLDTMHLDIPRHHLFTPKLSRLKRISTYQIWWSVCTLFPSPWFCPNGFSKGGF